VSWAALPTLLRSDQLDEFSDVGCVRYFGTLEPDPELLLGREDQHYVSDRIPFVDVAGGHLLAKLNRLTENLLEDARECLHDLVSGQGLFF
jgi:hypothetical protein